MTKPVLRFCAHSFAAKRFSGRWVCEFCLKKIKVDLAALVEVVHNVHEFKTFCHPSIHLMSTLPSCSDRLTSAGAHATVAL